MLHDERQGVYILSSTPQHCAIEIFLEYSKSSEFSLLAMQSLAGEEHLNLLWGAISKSSTLNLR